jgi:hypothetical protein
MKAQPSAQPTKVEHYCYAEGCERTIRDNTVFCDFHWKMLPPELQMELFNAYVIGQDADENIPTMTYLDVAMRCITFVAMQERKQP